MKLNASRGKIIGYRDMEVPYSLLSLTEDASSLAVILPGFGYSTEGPLLHYSTGTALHQNCDVLHVNYKYSSDAYSSFSSEELDAALEQDACNVLAALLCERNYERYYLIGKSIGTIAMAALLKTETFSAAKTVWLTPLLHEETVLQAMFNVSQEGLVFIGSDDRHFSAEAFQKIVEKGQLKCTLAEGVNHSFEHSGDTMRSLHLLSETMTKIEGIFKR